MAVVEVGTKVAVASREFSIPDSSLRDHLYGRMTRRKRGPQGVLSDNEDNQLVQWMLQMQVAHPISVPELKKKSG